MWVGASGTSARLSSLNLHLSFQVFVNFAKKQSDNLQQQEAPPLGAGPSPLQRLINMLKSRQTPTELSALISQAPDELESDDDEGLISFEEERVRSREQGGGREAVEGDDLS